MKLRSMLWAESRFSPDARLASSGMTIVELLIATTCMIMVMGAVFMIFSSQSKTATFEREIIDMQLNSRVAMERLTFLFSHAGYGCSESFDNGKTMSGDDPDTNATITIDSIVWDVQDNNATGVSPDSVGVVYGFKKVTEVFGNYSNTSSNIDLENGPSPQIKSTTSEFKNYISFYPNIEGNEFYQVTDASDPYDLDESVELLIDDSAVYMVTPTRVKVINGTLQFQNFCYDPGKWDIADNIQDLQLRYTTDGSTWVDDPANPNDVIGVSIDLLARTDDPDPNYTDVKTYILGGQTVGPFNDAFHRKHSRARVWLRNTE